MKNEWNGTERAGIDQLAVARARNDWLSVQKKRSATSNVVRTSYEDGSWTE